MVMNSLNQWMGGGTNLAEEVQVLYTPKCDPYADGDQTQEGFLVLLLELVPIPRETDHYISSEIMLPQGDKMARGCIVCHKHNTNGNVVGRANDDPILDECKFHS